MQDEKETSQLALYNKINDSSYENYLAKLPKEKAIQVQNKINAYKTGVYASAPILCYGPTKCPFIGKCPIPTVNIARRIRYWR